MTTVWIVEWAFYSDAPTTDSVWSTEEGANTRANDLQGDGDDYHLMVRVHKFTVDIPQGYQQLQ